jgi:hypothetical protein
MATRQLDVTDRLLPAIYAISLAFILAPLIDIVTNVWPMEPGDMQWRFAFFGVAANYLISPLFGVGMLAVAGALSHHRGVLLTAMVLAVIGAVALLVCSLLYGLDVLQLRGNVREEAAFAFKVGSAKSMFKMLLTAVALILVAVGSRRAWKDLKASTRSRD